MADLPKEPWAQSSDSVLQHFKVSPQNGLSQKQIAESREKYGYNELPEEPGTF